MGSLRFEVNKSVPEREILRGQSVIQVDLAQLRRQFTANSIKASSSEEALKLWKNREGQPVDGKTRTPSGSRGRSPSRDNTA
jgi:hypothetical protein